MQIRLLTYVKAVSFFKFEVIFGACIIMNNVCVKPALVYLKLHVHMLMFTI